MNRRRFLSWTANTLGALGLGANRLAAQHDSKLHQRMHQWDFGVPMALYDLKADPGQRVHLIDQPRHSARTEHMKKALCSEIIRTGDPQLANFDRLLRGEQPIVLQRARRRRTARS